MTRSKFRKSGLCSILLLVGCAIAPETKEPQKEKVMQVHYLEIVTAEVDKTCQALEELHDVEFSEPRVELGFARTALLKGQGMVGVRAPMRQDEDPVVRPYLLVAEIVSAVEIAKAAGAEIALPPTEIPGLGKCAIYIQSGIEHGLWQE